MLSMLLGQGLQMGGNMLSQHLQSKQQEQMMQQAQQQQQQAYTNNAYNAPKQENNSLQALAAQNTAPGTNYYNRAAKELGISTHRGQGMTPGTEISPTDPNYRQGGNYLAHTGQGNTQDIRSRANDLFIQNLTNQSQTIGNNLNTELSGQMNQENDNMMAQGLNQSVGGLNQQISGANFMQNMIAQVGQQKTNPTSFLQNLIGG